MGKITGLGVIILLGLSAEAAAICSGAGIVPVDNQTVDAAVQVNSAGSCAIPFHGSRGPMSGFGMVRRPAHGAASIDSLHVYYRPRPGYVGGDSFTFQRRGLTASGVPTVWTVRVAVTVTP